MNANTLSGRSAAYGLSAVITSIASMLLMIVKETHEETVLAWMKAATSHHWITHGLFDVVLFFALGYALSKLNGGKGITIRTGVLAVLIVAAACLSFVGISGFYLIEG